MAWEKTDHVDVTCPDGFVTFRLTRIEESETFQLGVPPDTVPARVNFVLSETIEANETDAETISQQASSSANRCDSLAFGVLAIAGSGAIPKVHFVYTRPNNWRRRRIDGFTIAISYGDVISVPRIPTGWSVHIDNSPLWKTTVTAHISVGAAALTYKQVGFFQNFLVIQRNDKEFPVHIEATVTTYFMGSSLKQGKRVIKDEELRLTAIEE